MRALAAFVAVAVPAAFAWFAPTGWLQAAQWAVVPLGLLLVAGLGWWAHSLRDEPGHGDGDPTTVWLPDPGGLEIDWDAELAGLLEGAVR